MARGVGERTQTKASPKLDYPRARVLSLNVARTREKDILSNGNKGWAG